MAKKVLYIQPLHPSGMDKLREKYEVLVANTEDKQELLKIAPGVSVIISRLTKIDKELMDAAGDTLEAVAKHGVGVDNIDVDEANARGIPVLTTGNANSVSVAEHAFFALGALAKRISYLDRAMRRGHWKSRDEAGSIDLYGKTIGVVGLGRIGRELASMAKNGFHMQVVVFDPYAKQADVEALGYTWTDDLDELCRICDAISLHVPLSDGTRGLIDARRLALMKPTAYLLNFSRGGIVDEDALYQALSDRRIAGAALDAFSAEPPDHTAPLFALDNVLLSPHCGTFSEDSRIRMSMQVAEGVDDVLSGRVPKFAFNKAQIYPNA